jgi:hypothetical protein
MKIKGNGKKQKKNLKRKAVNSMILNWLCHRDSVLTAHFNSNIVYNSLGALIVRFFKEKQ